MAYPTTSELVALANVPELSGSPAERQDAYRTAAIVAVEGYCGQSFDLTSGSVTLDGSGGQVLFLPQRCVSLTAVEAGGLSADDVVVLDPERDRVRVRSYGTSYYERAMRIVTETRPLWPRGRDNISLTGTWGWADCPATIALAIASDMGDQARSDSSPLAGSVTSLQGLGLTGYSQGNLSLQWGSRASSGAPIPLSPRAARLIDARYVWSSSAGRTV